MTNRRGGSPVRVAIIGDEPVTREGVVHTLESVFAVEVLESTRPYPGLPEKLHDLEPNVIVADLDVTHTQEAAFLTALKDACPESPIIVLTGKGQRESVFQAIVLGASGYVLKTAEKEELCSAVEAALSGSTFGGLEFTPKLMWEFVTHVRERKDQVRPIGLTKREYQLLRLMIQGNTTEEIAAELFLSVHTVRTYRQRLMQKLGARSTTEMVIYAFSQGLVRIPGMNESPGISRPQMSWPEPRPG